MHSLTFHWHLSELHLQYIFLDLETHFPRAASSLEWPK